MGWAGGSRLFSEVISAIQPEIENAETRKEIYKKLIDAFEEEDCDTLNECCGEDQAYDEAFEELHSDE